MKYYKIILPLLILTMGMISCGDDLITTPEAQEDFRDAFVGIYDCEKGSTVIELEVSIDPDNENNLLVGPYSLPVDQEGSYGPEYIEQNTLIELRFDGDKIYYREQMDIINGIVLPCVLEGKKRI